MMYFLAILSFLLDGLFLSFISSHSLFLPLFSLLAVLICYPLSKNVGKNYYFVCILLGFFYDICYANSLFFHTIMFPFFGWMVDRVYQKFQVNFVNAYLLGISMIVVYRLFFALFLVALPSFVWDTKIFLGSIASSFFLNSIYLVIFYFFTKKVIQKKRNQKFSSIEFQK